MRTSTPIILAAIAMLYVVDLSGIAELGNLPMASMCSWIVLDIMGFFKREKAKLAPETNSDEPELNDRQKAFRQSLEAGRPEEQPDAHVVIIDEDGTESSIIIRANGEIETTGNPPDDIVKAAMGLQESIKMFGVESAVMALQKAIQERDDKEDDGKSE